MGFHSSDKTEGLLERLDLQSITFDPEVCGKKLVVSEGNYVIPRDGGRQGGGGVGLGSQMKNV